ncbi:cytochrome P450 [Astrocystis sublimbata]|nr:cytochrome P450 [Astrocystis sublimbata]
MLTYTVGIAFGIALLLYVGYRWALPKPLPGIPYNVEATKNLLGDIPDLMRELSETGDLCAWVLKQNVKVNSPISQIFIQPFSKPIVLLSDWRAARDIMVHRTHEFDRSSMMTSYFRGILNRQQFTLQTGPEWKMHRRIVQDTMSPTFLNKKAGPAIYAHSLEWLKLWELKAQLAEGRPFVAGQDIFRAALDGVLGFAFGSQFAYSATTPQLEGLVKMSSGERQSFLTGSQRAGADAPVEFPEFHFNEGLRSMLQLSEMMEEVKNAPSVPIKWWFLKQTTAYKRRMKSKDDCIRGEIARAIETRKKHTEAAGEDEEEEEYPSWMRCAVETVVDREERHAKRDGRKPDFFAPIVMDEIFGFVVAGHDTISTTLSWAVKFLADNPPAQSQLRKSLRSSHAAAVAEKRFPTVEEITQTSIPYLDATMEEVLRCAGIVPIGDREAQVDTVLLGHRIPKGTIVCFLNNGAGVRQPELEANEQAYGSKAQHLDQYGKARPPSWDNGDVASFKPERWLVSRKDAAAPGNGKLNEDDLVFDSQAGPSMPFGLGIRGCFGKRLAYLEYKIYLTMLIWNFELLECPKELSSYAGLMALVHKPRNCYVKLRKIEC